jgi:hypothetical protein
VAKRPIGFPSLRGYNRFCVGVGEPSLSREESGGRPGIGLSLNDGAGVSWGTEGKASNSSLSRGEEDVDPTETQEIGRPGGCFEPLSREFESFPWGGGGVLEADMMSGGGNKEVCDCTGTVVGYQTSWTSREETHTSLGN